ncbi:hypothetical protein [Brachybacterium huguangmaarense]
MHLVPAAASATAPPATAPAAPVDPDRPDWARRLLRIGLWILGFGLAGVALAASGVALAFQQDSLAFPADAADFPEIRGTATVTPQDASAVAAYSRSDRTFPDGDCTATGPGGAPARLLPSMPVRTPAIDGVHLDNQYVFDAPTPGAYEISCTVDGYLAGPAWTYDDPEPTDPAVSIFLGAQVPTGVLMLGGFAAVPVLLAALVVRLAAGARSESAARRRADRPLALAAAATLLGVPMAVMGAVVLALSALDDQGLGPANGFAVLGMVLVVAPFLVLAVLGAVLARRRGRALRAGAPVTRAALEPTEP